MSGGKSSISEIPVSILMRDPISKAPLYFPGKLGISNPIGKTLEIIFNSEVSSFSQFNFFIFYYEQSNNLPKGETETIIF